MPLNKDNDIYNGDLSTLNNRKQAWARGDVTSAKYSKAKWVVLAIGFAGIIYTSTRTFGGTTMMSQFPLHVSIWLTALVTFLVAKKGKDVAQLPFTGFHMAHFEVDDDTVYYVFQKGMTLRTYYIKDGSIKRIFRDDEAGVILIQGPAKVNIRTRKGETEESVDEFYALIPFDKYDLDDLLQPYRKKVTQVNGKLRTRYTEENLLNHQ